MAKGTIFPGASNRVLVPRWNQWISLRLPLPLAVLMVIVADSEDHEAWLANAYLVIAGILVATFLLLFFKADFRRPS